VDINVFKQNAGNLLRFIRGSAKDPRGAFVLTFACCLSCCVLCKCQPRFLCHFSRRPHGNRGMKNFVRVFLYFFTMTGLFVLHVIGLT
jgi:hypothetical protein